MRFLKINPFSTYTADLKFVWYGNFQVICFQIKMNYRTLAKLSLAYSKLARFLDALIFELCLFSRHDYSKYPWIFRHYFSKYSLYFGWFQCIQMFLCLNYTFWIYCYGLISTFIPKKYVIYVSTAIFSAEEI